MDTLASYHIPKRPRLEQFFEQFSPEQEADIIRLIKTEKLRVFIYFGRRVISSILPQDDKFVETQIMTLRDLEHMCLVEDINSENLEHYLTVLERCIWQDIYFIYRSTNLSEYDYEKVNNVVRNEFKYTLLYLAYGLDATYFPSEFLNMRANLRDSLASVIDVSYTDSADIVEEQGVLIRKIGQQWAQTTLYEIANVHAIIF